MGSRALHLLLASLGGYVVGSVPFGLWLTHVKRGVDIREHGSGSSGTTNVLRIVGPGAAAATFALDAGKGVVAIRVARALGVGEIGQALAGVGAMVGHSWPWMAHFRGGKGVATALGVELALAPAAVPLTLAGGLAALAATRTMSIGSLSAAGTATVVTAARAVRGDSLAPYLFTASAATLILARHSANIRRIAAGTEPRLTWSKRAARRD